MMTWDALTPAQKVALRHPCYFAIETSHPRYGRREAVGSVLVTVNTGYE